MDRAGHPAPERLSAWIDGELGMDEQAEIARHVASCPACGGLAEDFRALADAQARSAVPPVPDGLEDRIVRGLRRPAAGTRRWMRPLGAAATVLAGLVAVWLVGHRPEEAFAPAPPATPPPAAVAPAPEAPRPVPAPETPEPVPRQEPPPPAPHRREKAAGEAPPSGEPRPEPFAPAPQVLQETAADAAGSVPAETALPEARWVPEARPAAALRHVDHPAAAPESRDAARASAGQEACRATFRLEPEWPTAGPLGPVAERAGRIGARVAAGDVPGRLRITVAAADWAALRDAVWGAAPPVLPAPPDAPDACLVVVLAGP